MLPVPGRIVAADGALTFEQQWMCKGCLKCSSYLQSVPKVIRCLAVIHPKQLLSINSPSTLDLGAKNLLGDLYSVNEMHMPNIQSSCLVHPDGDN